MISTRGSLRIYLADLTHVGSGVATEAFPLNIGLIASYAKKTFANDVTITLFKYPGDLEEAILREPPHILACSNYTWNSNLSYYFCSLLKSIDPHIITVFGGTNYPFDEEPQKRFLELRPQLDTHVYYEGEHSFANIVERFLSVSNPQDVFNEPVGGCQFIDAGTGTLINGPSQPRIRDLDMIPSPYVTGLLDKFFDGRLTPLIETARGCPFTCNFCNAYHSYFTKVNKFSDDYVREELGYVAMRASQAGIGHVTFADNNFGMIPRDAATADYLGVLQRKYGWPTSMTAWTGKNAKERVIAVTRALGDTLSINMSVQSMDEQVLRDIGRRNIKVDHYQAIADELNAQGRPQHAEVIMPLPGETFQSHVNGLKKLVDSNISQVLSHTLQMLHGTPYKDSEPWRKSYGYITKYRLVPLDFTRIRGRLIFDVEEVAVATNTFSFDEYVEARKFLLVTDLCYSSGIFEPLKKYLRSWNVKNSDWVQFIFDRLGDLPAPLKEIFESFVAETRSELWDSEEELVSYYSESKHFKKVLKYEIGGNVLFKHRIRMLTQASHHWVEIVFRYSSELLLMAQARDARERIERELASLERYVLGTVVDTFTLDALEEDINSTFDHDILRWLGAPGSEPLSKFATGRLTALKFYFDANSVGVMRDAFQAYGTDLAGLVKMVQRRSGVTLVRRVAYEREPDTHSGGTRNQMYGPGWSSV